MIKLIKTWFLNKNPKIYGYGKLPNGAKLPYGVRYYPLQKNKVEK